MLLGIYVCGGSNGSSSTSRAEYLDLQVGDWQRLPPLSAARSGAVCGVLFGRVYVAGGQDGRSKGVKRERCFQEGDVDGIMMINGDF